MEIENKVCFREEVEKMKGWLDSKKTGAEVK